MLISGVFRSKDIAVNDTSKCDFPSHESLRFNCRKPPQAAMVYDNQELPQSVLSCAYQMTNT